MTWQKVIGAKTQKEAQFKVAGDSATPEDLGMEPTHGQAAEMYVNGLFLELEAKNGNQYEFGVTSDGTVDIHEMAEDIVTALDEDMEVWADIDFDGGDAGNDGRVLYWAAGAPWNGGDVKDDYGIYEGV